LHQSKPQTDAIPWSITEIKFCSSYVIISSQK
jgi:hypothetical protein